MIIDGALLLDSGHQISASAATEASTNVIDLLNARDMGIGDDPALKILCQVVTAFATTNSAVLTAAFQGSTDNVTYTTMIQSQASLTPGNLTVGSRILQADVPRPAPGQSLPRYLRMLYTVGTGIFSLGNVTTAVVLDRQDYVAYPAGINVQN